MKDKEKTKRSINDAIADLNNSIENIGEGVYKKHLEFCRNTVRAVARELRILETEAKRITGLKPTEKKKVRKRKKNE